MSKKFLIFLIIFLSLASFLIFDLKEVRAGTEHNVSGWAWSENIGWISFNSTTDGSLINYGVNIDSNRIFSGYAWSENIGWISFNKNELTDCPISPCRAKLDFQTKQISGWARALAYGDGWDGWIRLRDTDYGVWLDTSLSPAEFRNWAWGSDVVGWISFNNKDGGGTIIYKVVTTFVSNQPPDKPIPWTPEFPDGESWDHCSFKEKSIPTFHWQYSDPENDPQTAYEIWLDDNPNFSDPKFNNLVEHSPLAGPYFAYTLNLADDDNSDWLSQLSWGTTYYWKIRVRDEKNNWSEFSDLNSFETPGHAYPWIDFKWSPQTPAVNETVQFTDLSEVFGGTNKSAFYWTFQDGVPATSIEQNPETKFSSVGLKEVTEEVTDSDGYACTGSKTLANIEFPLPEWKEIPPWIYLFKFLALISAPFINFLIFN